MDKDASQAPNEELAHEVNLYNSEHGTNLSIEEYLKGPRDGDSMEPLHKEPLIK